MTEQIDIIGGEIGGSGKSTYGKVHLEFLLSKDIKFYLVDADKTTPNVGLSYAKEIYTEEFLNSTSIDATYIAAGEQEANNSSGSTTGLKMQRIILGDTFDRTLELDHLFDLAKERRVVMVLPSQSWDQVANWVVLNTLWNSKHYQVRYWFVCNGTDESVALLEKSIGLLKIPHILVKNKGGDNFAENWARQEKSPKYKDAIQRLTLAGTCEFGLIPMMAAQRDTFRSQNQRFRDLEKLLNPVAWDRVSNFLDESFKSIEATGQIILPSKVPPKKPTPNS